MKFNAFGYEAGFESLGLSPKQVHLEKNLPLVPENLTPDDGKPLSSD
jgi:hypothetical protein